MPQQNNNRETRVFLSSTFRDMQYERDYLIKNIFPQIRQACRERLVEFTEVDLRWGVTQEEAEQGKVVRICLEEIDRCRPYFLGFMGERYGWAPSDGDLHKKQELIQQFPVVEASIKAGKSVTEMEVLHGVLNNPAMAGHAFFYLRDIELTETLAKKTANPAEYFETDGNGRAKLGDLKSRVKQSGFPVRENYHSIETLGEQIKVDLLAVLDQRYPADQTPSPIQAERNAHEAYAENRCKAYIANPADIAALDGYLQACNSEKFNTPLIIGGKSGLGKSALLAYWVSRVEASKPKQFLIQHYAGVSGDATSTAVLRRIMMEIKDRTQEQDEVPSKPEDIIQDFSLWLAKVRSDDSLLIVLDAINQIEGDNLNWLPIFIPHNVTLVVSCLPGSAFEQLVQRGWKIHNVEPLNTQRREQLIDTYLANYRKALSAAQKQTLAQVPQCANPLFLLTVLEELRVFGSFEQLDAKMQTCLAAKTPAELFGVVLARMEADYGKQIVQAVMSAIWAARKGLSETELLGITGLTRLDISTFLLALDYHLARKSGLLNFFHDYLRQAVKARYLPDQDDAKVQHRKLAEWFEHQPLDSRKAEELPWQWQQANERENLRDCISDIPMFFELDAKDEYELLGYWNNLPLGDAAFEPSECYKKSVSDWEESELPDLIEVANALNNLSIFIGNYCRKFDTAKEFAERSLFIRDNFTGESTLETATSLNNMGCFLSETDEYDEALKSLERALAIRKRILGSEASEVAGCLMNIANVKKGMGNLVEAKLLYEQSLAIKTNLFGIDHFETADVINNLAGVLSAMGDLEEAGSLYERAIDIQDKCLGPFNAELSDSLYNLANILEEKGDAASARRMHERALLIREKVRGPNHPFTIASREELAVLLLDTHEFDEVRKLYQRALDLCEQVYGHDHFETASSKFKLALTLFELGDYSEALALCEKSLPILEKENSSDYSAIASYLSFYSRVLRKLGMNIEARPILERSISICEDHLGANHKETVGYQAALGNLLRDVGDYDSAIALYERVHPRIEAIDGAESESFAIALDNHASLLRSMKRYSEARPMQERALSIKEIVLGKDHPEVAMSIHNLANLLCDMASYSEAEELYQRAIAISENQPVKNNPNAKIFKSNFEACMQEKFMAERNQNSSTQKGVSTMSNMRITEVIVQWLEMKEWEERPEVNEEKQTSSTGFGYQISDDFSVTCYIDAAEKLGFIKLFMYFADSKIPASKMDEVIEFVNHVNLGMPVGQLAVVTDDRCLRFYTGTDVEDAALEPQHISNMLSAGIRAMKYRLPQYMAICFGGKTAEEALQIEPEE